MSSAPAILIVDDDEIVLTALCEILELEDYTLFKASDPAKALQLAQIHSFAVVIADQIMPGMTGLDLLEKIHHIQPGASRILITGALSISTLMSAINEAQIFRIISKPWMREDFVNQVRAAVEYHRSRNSNDQGASIETILQFIQTLLTAYNPWIGKETRAITSLCENMIATGLVPADVAAQLRIAAVTHNIGLIGLSREIFAQSRNYPDDLSDAQKEILRAHPQKSAQLIANIGQLRLAQGVVLAHHEHWNATGYPMNLAGQMIPPAARLLAVAIAYVECGLPKNSAIEYITENAGILFEPEAVRLFLKATQLAPMPEHIQEMLVSELSPGMRLARDLTTPTGLLIVPAENTLDSPTIAKLFRHNQSEPIQDRVLIYR